MINFRNLKIAFSDKSNTDLNRAYLLFKTMNSPFLSKILTGAVQFAFKIHLPIKPIIKETVYKHFCGGETIEETQKIIDKLKQSNIGTILDFSAEGKESEADFNKVLMQILASIEKASNSNSIPFTVFKPTGLCKFSILEKISNKTSLSSDEKIEKKKYEKRVNSICKLAFEKNVAVFIDGEESWIQDAIDNIAEEMMHKYNKYRPLIYNTIQLYRKDRIVYLNSLLERAEKNFFVGVKLVRGAYHEQEIKRAKANNYSCPVHTIKENTDNDYSTALKLCLRNIDRIAVCAGTHNEKSTQLLTKLLKEYNLSKNDKRVCFSQLLGMSDHISYNLAKKGYNVSKYVPYGPIRDLIPYLIRRAQENTSISGQMGRELSNIIEEKTRRKRFES